MMISSPNIVGLRTSTAASRTTSSIGRRRLSPWAMCRTQFSTITTELSTTMPKSIAPRLSRLAAMPNRSMPEKANSIDSGMARATISAARRLPRNANSTATTSSPPSNRLFLHRVDDVVDQLRAVVDGCDLDVRRQRGLDLVEPVLHRPGDVVRVLAHEHEAQAQHDLALAVGGDGAAADLVSRSPRRPRRPRGSARRPWR